MFKNTINKAFQKKFPNNIWKIEVDPFCNYLGVETRNEDTTTPHYTVLAFDGALVMDAYPLNEKDWMMEAIQHGFIILKKVGENTPVKEGIRVIHSESRQEVFTNYEYQLLDVYDGYIKVRHRSVISGGEQLIRIEDGSISPNEIQRGHLAPSEIVFPISYDKKPQFLTQEDIIDYLWLSKIDEDRYTWCYHLYESGSYRLVLTLSDLNQILDQEVILDNMEKMIPQPYFQVGKQLFFLSQNKQEIVSYLV